MAGVRGMGRWLKLWEWEMNEIKRGRGGVGDFGGEGDGRRRGQGREGD